MTESELKEQLKNIISQATGGAIVPSKIGDYTSFMELGVDSMAAVEVVMNLETQFGVSITDMEAGKEAFTSIQALADFVRANSEIIVSQQTDEKTSIPIKQGDESIHGEVQIPLIHEHEGTCTPIETEGEPDNSQESIVDPEVDNLIGEYVKNKEQSEQLVQLIQGALMPQIEALVNESVSVPLRNLIQQHDPQMLQEALLPGITTTLKAAVQDVLSEIVRKSVSQAITEIMPHVIEESVKNRVSDAVSISIREYIPQIIHETLPASVETTLRQSLSGILHETVTLKDFFRLLFAKIRR